MPSDQDTPKLLVVDDHVDTQRLMAVVLQRAGYAVSTAGDFDSAIALARAQRFDLVITDVWLPGRDGCELLAELGELYPVRAIVLSGSRSEDYENLCNGLEVQCLRKPVAIPDLLAAAAAELGTDEGARL